ncbi:MAG: ImmA/IrrE family metallo-endopeptidase [Sphingomonadales bacterium]|nr:ImmA/IrrE family metallo-endopeptidase [Sphingomonadales bacterium]
MTVTPAQEIEANRFAMELLIPEEWLRRDLCEIGGSGVGP